MDTQHLEFPDIYDEFHGKILNFLTRLVGENEAEEVAQVVFEKINQNLKRFKGESKLSTWIYRIATNSALDKLKSASFKYSQSGPLAPFPIHEPKMERLVSINENKPVSLDKKIIREEVNECIREFIDRLPLEYRTIIILKELEGFTNKEIAKILEVSLDTAKIRLHRARASLRQSLETGCDFYHDERNELACDRKQPQKK